MVADLPCESGPRTDTAPTQPLRNSRAGFTIVEVVIAVVILAVGLLGMAGTTLLVVKQTTLADVTTERSVALRSTLERLRAMPYDSVVNGSDSIGAFSISWTVTDVGLWRDVELVTVGPGLRSGSGFPTVAPSVPDTFTFRVLQP